MLLKCCQSTPSERRTKVNVNKVQRNCTVSVMKLAVGSGGTAPRGQRKVARPSNKRPATGKRIILPAGLPEYQTADPEDSSNDSGLGFEPPGARPTSRLWCTDIGVPAKRKKLEIKLESEDANDNFMFEETINLAKRGPLEAQLLLPALSRVGVPRPAARRPAQRRVGPTLLATQLLAGVGSVRPVKPHLQILSQPEQQHRARYQTEGSRGAVKDRTGNGFPTVKLVGYDGSATLQVFIGSDLGRVVPHMFYQACRVSGKNSTPCSEKNVDGTVVIEVEFEPSKDNVITCDCVGILKERNVDVEHRFPEQLGSRNKKKSTRCRMVFRSVITHPDGTEETLEISSQPIVCTQPPGIPEICKKSLSSSPCTGGQELFILGKNFLKDTRIVFSTCESQPLLPLWEVSVQPDKEYLQQSHLVCVVPPYCDVDLSEPVNVRLSVMSSGKMSESHSFRYTPHRQQQVGNTEETQQSVTKVQSGSKQPEQKGFIGASPVVSPTILRPISTPYLLVQSAQGGGKESVFIWKPATGVKDGRLKKKLMPTAPLSSPPPLQPLPSLAVPARVQPIAMKQLSASLMTTDDMSHSPTGDVSRMSQVPQSTTSVSPVSISSETVPSTETPVHFTPAALPMASGADLSCTQSPSLATLRRFVSAENVEWALPALNVEKFLSGLEHKPESKLEDQRKTFDDSQLLLESSSALHATSPNCAEKVNFNLPSPTLNLVSTSRMMLHPTEIQIESTKHADDENSSHSSPVGLASNNVAHSFSNNVAPTILCSSLASSQISAVQNARLDALVSSAMTVATANTERLEALVNSAADCHLSPTVSSPSYDMIPQNHFSEEMLKKDALTLNTVLTNGCSLESQNILMNVIHSPCQQLPENIFVSESQSTLCNLPLSTESLSPKHGERNHIAPSTFPAENFHSSVSVVSEHMVDVAHPSIYNPTAPLLMTSHVDQQLISADPVHLAELVNSTLDAHLLPAVTERVSDLCPLTGNVSTLESGCENVNNLFSGRSEASFIAEASTLNEPCCSIPLGPHFSIASDGAACTTSGMHCTTSNLILGLAKDKDDVMATPIKLEPESAAKSQGMQKREEGMVPRELTQMSENDLLSYINPSCFDTV